MSIKNVDLASAHIHARYVPGDQADLTARWVEEMSELRKSLLHAGFNEGQAFELVKLRLTMVQYS